MPNIDAASFYAPMNASVARARKLAEEKGMRDDAYGERMRSSELADADMARQMRQRQFDEGGRQFDAKANMFREMLARKMPDFFGAGSTPTMGGMDGSFGRTSAAGGTPAFSFGGNDPGLDQATRNYLLRFLRG